MTQIPKLFILDKLKWEQNYELEILNRKVWEKRFSPREYPRRIAASLRSMVKNVLLFSKKKFVETQ